MIELLGSTIRLSTPLLFAALGGLLCERTGVATICLEGVMLVAAWSAATVNFLTGNPWLGLFAGCASGALAMGLHAFLSITARANRIVSGVAVNILCAGITPLLTKVLFGGTTNTPAIEMSQRFTRWEIPGLKDIPFLGSLFFSHFPLVYLAALLPLILHFWIYHTRAGLRINAAGDAPEALATSGVSPNRIRYQAMLAGGVIASLGGVYLATSHGSQFTRDMTAGRGFIALTALIFGKWKPLPTFGACLIFGFADALQIQLQGVSILGQTFPVQLIQALPYLLTLVVLVTFVGRSRPPLDLR